MRHVQRRQVHQLEGPELEADLVAQDAVDGGEVGHAFAHDAQGLRAKAAPGVVHDKAWGVLCLHGGVAHGFGIGGQRRADGRIGLEARNDLHHLHQRNGVEEVKPRQAFRVLEGCANRRHGQGGCVGRQHRIGAHHPLQFNEEGLFGIQPLHDGLHHQVAGRQLGHRCDRVQPCSQRRGLVCLDPAFGDQLVPLFLQGGAGGIGGPGVGVQQKNLAPGLGCNLRDAPAHGAGAHDGDVGKLNFHSGIMALALSGTYVQESFGPKNRIDCENP